MSGEEFDALLIVSFGGPEGPEDVLPFLRNVTRGRDVPEERLRAVGEQYYARGGISPINAQNQALVEAVRRELARRDWQLPVFWGNRNWKPYLVDALAQMRDQGLKSAMAFFTSAYSSYSGCRQYRENLADAVTELGEAISIERLGPYFNHRGFVEPFVDGTAEAVMKLSRDERRSAHIVFTTHSIPITMAQASGVHEGAYVRQHQEVASVVADAVADRVGSALPWSLAYQSRSGSPHVPWLEPDINDHLRELCDKRCSHVVVVPIGFVSDHMEVLWDLDTQAAATAAELGMTLLRVPTPGTDARTVAMVVDLAMERRDGVPRAERRRCGVLPASPDRCPAGCCANPRTELSAVAQDVADTEQYLSPLAR